MCVSVRDGGRYLLHEFATVLTSSSSWCICLPFFPSQSFLPWVKLTPLKDYNTVPIHHMLLVSAWMRVCVFVCICLLFVFPYLMPPIAWSQSMSSFERRKQKQRRTERGHQVHLCICEYCSVCVYVCVNPAGWCAMRQDQMVTPGKAGWACLPASLWVMSVSLSA